MSSQEAYLTVNDGTKVRVDPEQLEELNQFRWSRSSKGTTIMRSAGGGKQMMTLGRHIMGLWPSERLQVKRIDARQEDYRKENLEVVLLRERGKMPKHISWHTYSLSFRVKFQLAKTKYEHKGFKTIEEAVKARDRLIERALLEHPDWPPSRVGERRGRKPEPRSLAERLWRTLEMREVELR